MRASIALVGDSGAAYREESTLESLRHAATALAVGLEQTWIETAELTSGSAARNISDFGGIWIVPGSPCKNLEGVLDVIRLAREQGLPLLGTCGGFQHVVLEFIRNVLGFRDAAHAEYDPHAKEQALSRLTCSLVGQKQVVRFEPGSNLARIYSRSTSEEQFHCNYGVNPAFESRLSSSALKIVGRDHDNGARAVELAGHPFFIGTLFIPQYSSRPDAPHPLISAFVTAASRPMVKLQNACG